MGAFLGWVYWKYNLETVIVAHYAYDAFLIGWPLLHSGNSYYVASGAVVTGLALVPALVGLVLVRRRGVPDLAALPATAAPEQAPAPVAAPAVNPLEGHWLVQMVRSRPRLWVAAGLAGLVLSLALWPAGPGSLAPEYTVTEAQAEATARQYLQGQGFDLINLRVVRRMVKPGFLSYVSDTAPAAAGDLMREYAAARWEVRFYQPLNPVDYRVEIDIRTGQVVRFSRNLPGDHAGGYLDPAAARHLAETFLQSNALDPAGLFLAVDASSSYAQRMDHHFVWESRDPRLPDARIQREVVVQGARVGSYRAPFVHVPEAWQREEETRMYGFVGLGMLVVLGGLAALVMAIIYLARGLAPFRTAALLALGVSGLMLVSGLGSLGTAAAAYDTTMIWGLHVTMLLIGLVFSPVVAGVGAAALWVVGKVVARFRPPELSWRSAAVGGLAVAALALAVDTLLRLVGAGPTTPSAPHIHSGHLSLLTLASLPAMAAMFEFAGRLWLLSLLLRWTRRPLLAAVIHALLLTLLMAGLENGLEWTEALSLFLGDGLIFSIAYLSGGIRLVVVAGAVQPLVSSGLGLVGAGIPSAAATGSITLALVVLLPLILWFVFRPRPAPPIEA